MRELTTYNRSLLHLLGLLGAWEKAPDDKARAEVWNKAQRQLWATPQAFVNGLSFLSGTPVMLDVCAEEDTAKAPKWFGVSSEHGEDGLHALKQARRLVLPGGALWCNPPFIHKGNWADALSDGEDRAFLNVPPSTDQHWFGDLHQNGRAWLSVIQGRMPYIPPEGVKSGSPNGPTVVWAINFDYRPLPPVLNWRDVIRIGGGQA